MNVFALGTRVRLTSPLQLDETTGTFVPAGTVGELVSYWPDGEGKTEPATGIPYPYIVLIGESRLIVAADEVEAVT